MDDITKAKQFTGWVYNPLAKRVHGEVDGDSMPSEDLRGFLGRVITAICRKRRMSQQQLADLSGVSQSQVSMYSSGNKDPRLSTFSRMVDAIGLKVIVIADPNIPDGICGTGTPWLSAFDTVGADGQPVYYSADSISFDVPDDVVEWVLPTDDAACCSLSVGPDDGLSSGDEEGGEVADVESDVESDHPIK